MSHLLIEEAFNLIKSGNIKISYPERYYSGNVNYEKILTILQYNKNLYDTQSKKRISLWIFWYVLHYLI